MAKAKAKKATAAAPAKKGGKKAAKGAKAKKKAGKQEAAGIKGRFSRAQASRSKTAAKGGSRGGGSRTIQFLREVKVEMSKVTWPSRDELVQSTIAVMVAVLITGVFIFLLDVAFSRLIGLVS